MEHGSIIISEPDLRQHRARTNLSMPAFGSLDHITVDQPLHNPRLTPYSTSSIMASNTVEIPGIVFAGVAVMVALLALLVGILQLRTEQRIRHEAHEREIELLELEAEIAEVSRGRNE